MVKECRPMKHEWVLNERTIDQVTPAGREVVFAYKEQMCMKCYETMNGGVEVQTLLDMAMEGRLLMFHRLFLLHVCLYGRVPVKPSLKRDLEYLKQFLESKGGLLVEYPSLFIVEGRAFVNALSRTISFLVEYGYVKVSRSMSGKFVTITKKGVDSAPKLTL